MVSEKTCPAITKIFAAIGMIATGLFILIALVVAYVWFADPLEIRPFIQEISSGNDGSTPAEEEALLESLGVQKKDIPTELTRELETCGRETLGDERVDELLGGAEPTINDVIKARTCLKNE